MYLLTINNAQENDVYIDGAKYTLKDHKAIDSDDANLYVYLKSGHHIVKTGNIQSCYHYSNGFSQCILSYTYNGNLHWQNCSDAVCNVEHNKSSHSYSWKSDDSQYWKACICGKFINKQSIPTITINGSDKVSRANDYKYSVSYPQGVTITSATGTLQNDEYVVSKSNYSGDSLKIEITAKTSDGFIFTKSKTVVFKEEPKSSDFTFNPPENTVYNGQPMEASVTSQKIDNSKISIKYYRDSYILSSAPVDVGTYTVKIDVAESDNYAAKNNITDSEWYFTVTQATPTVIDEDKTTARIRRGRSLEEATVIYDSTFMGVNGVLTGTYEWADKSEIASSEKGYEMIFTPDNANYKPVTFNVQVTFYASTPLYTVKFNTDGAGTIENQIVVKNNMATKPEEPVKEGYIFSGWYTDREFDRRYDFDTLVKGSFTLYAKWIEDNSEEMPGDNIDSDNPFTDVSEDDWFYEGVMYASKNKLMNGVTNTEFAPNFALTRGMLVTVLYRLAGEPDVDGTFTFEDVESGSYYNSAVIWAQQNGIVMGIGENQFAPDENITREQIAAIFYRYAKAMGYDVSVGEDTNVLSYADFDEISDYAIDAVQYAVGSGLMQGKTDNTFNPADFATRGEIATILQRFIEANE